MIDPYATVGIQLITVFVPMRLRLGLIPRQNVIVDTKKAMRRIIALHHIRLEWQNLSTAVTLILNLSSSVHMGGAVLVLTSHARLMEQHQLAGNKLE